MSQTNQRPLLLGLIGSPIKSSASPAMHQAAGQAVGLRTHYQLVDIPDADTALLRTLLDGVRHLGFAGVNVTFPYKEAVLPLLDRLSEGARAVGAVNTVVVENGLLVGHNTDASGFGRAVIRAFGASPPGPVALIGAGGVGKAIAVALAALPGASIRIVDTDAAKARDLAAAIGPAAQACATIEEAVRDAGGLVNATPIGMLPNRDNPVPNHLLRRDLWVADAVYSPLWTPLLEAARRVGAPVMTGRELAIDQALDAFVLFTGREPPREAMARAFDDVMAARRETNEAAAA